MVIIDDKPPNWPGAPPPYVRSGSQPRSQAGSSSSRASPRPGVPGLRITNPTEDGSSSHAATSAYTLPETSASGSRSTSKRPRPPNSNEDAYQNLLRRTAEEAPISPSGELAPPPFPRPRERKTLLDLPQHILLYIMQLTCLPRGRIVPESTLRGSASAGGPPAYQESRRYAGYNPDAKTDYRGLTREGYAASYYPDEDISEEDGWAEHAAGLNHLAVSVRLTCRALYISACLDFSSILIDSNRVLSIACMHILRSTYLPIYSLNIKPPYTSDPFPADTPTYTVTPYTSASSTSASVYMPPNSSPLLTTHRETAVLDQFILLTLRQNLLSSESSLHLTAHPIHSTLLSFTPLNLSAASNYVYYDLFSLHQPTARLEDLVLHYGLQNGSVTLAPSSSRMVAFDYISIKLTEGARRVGLVVSDTKGRKRVMAEYLRENKNEKLEIAAKRLAMELLAILRRSRGG